MVGEKVAEFTNKELGVTAVVVRGDGGKFHVALHDDDAGQVVPLVKILGTQAEAEALAKTLVADTAPGAVEV